MRTQSMMLFVLIVVGGVEARAVDVEFSRVDYRVTAEQSADGAPENGHVADFFATTDADIISVNQVLIEVSGGELFNITRIPCLACNGALLPDGFPLNPAEVVDSFVTTPGPTLLLGPDLPGDGTTLFGDLTNDGPQNFFQFARITIPAGATGNFSGRITLAGLTAPERFPFSFPLGIPEPSSLLLIGLGTVCSLSLRNRKQREG